MPGRSGRAAYSAGWSARPTIPSRKPPASRTTGRRACTRFSPAPTAAMPPAARCASRSTAAGGARKKNGLRGSGQRLPRSEMQHSRLRTKKSALPAASTTSGATSDSGGPAESASATLRPSIVSPASATVIAMLGEYAPLARERLLGELLEARDELLALGQQAALLDEPGADTPLHPLDERAILRADLPVEGEQLVGPAVLRARGEEVVEESRRALRAPRQERPDREVRRAGVDVHPQVGPDEVELPLSRAARGSELREDVIGRRREPVGVRGDVVGGAEPSVRDRAVVALEVVLAGDLPVRRELVLVARMEDEPVDGDEVGQPAECRRERRRALVGVDEQERAPCLEAKRQEGELGRVEAGLALRAGRGPKGAVEAVRPGVIRALDGRLAAVALDEERAAVAADVEEGAEPVVRAHDEDRHVAGPRGKALSRLLGPPGVADVLPRPAKDALLLPAQHLRIGVPAPRQGARGGH